jgi:hypothetical protein
MAVNEGCENGYSTNSGSRQGREDVSNVYLNFHYKHQSITHVKFMVLVTLKF